MTRCTLLGTLLALLAAGCGDNLILDDVADLRSADRLQLGQAIDAASGQDAIDAAALVLELSKGDASACPRVEALADGSTALTGGCDGALGPVLGRALIESPFRSGRTRITLEGFGDAVRAFDGVIEQDPDGGNLSADLDNLAVTTHLSVTCDAVGLCVPADSWIDVDGLGRAEIAGAWRNAPAGGYLTLIGDQTLTLDLNQRGDCMPYTIDGEAAGCL